LDVDARKPANSDALLDIMPEPRKIR